MTIAFGVDVLDVLDVLDALDVPDVARSSCGTRNQPTLRGAVPC
jgi:S-ribosylhomocysteine lyase LuxS involved in autoinducer biosynthesis